MPETPRLPSGEIDWTKVPTGTFILAMLGLLLVGGGAMLFAWQGIGFMKLHQGVIVQKSTNRCADYTYLQIVGRMDRGNHVVPDGSWEVFSREAIDGEIIGDLVTPYGRCDQTTQNCCRQLGLQVVKTPSGLTQKIQRHNIFDGGMVVGGALFIGLATLFIIRRYKETHPPQPKSHHHSEPPATV